MASPAGASAPALRWAAAIPAVPQSPAICAPRSGWRGAMMVNQSLPSACEAAITASSSPGWVEAARSTRRPSAARRSIETSFLSGLVAAAGSFSEPPTLTAFAIAPRPISLSACNLSTASTSCAAPNMACAVRRLRCHLTAALSDSCAETKATGTSVAAVAVIRFGQKSDSRKMPMRGRSRRRKAATMPG